MVNLPGDWGSSRWPKGANALGRFPCCARVAIAEYRIYRIATDGNFTGFETLVCDDDGQAIDKAKQMLHGSDLQI
jgi:hypothetical protein